MSRYLTPSKITLLVLVFVHQEGVIPTSASVPILAFILSNILQSHDKDHPSLVSPDDASDVVPIQQIESALSSHASSIPGRTVWDLLLKKLWAIDCSDALDAFIHGLPLLLTKSREQILRERETGEPIEIRHGRILRTSPVGTFLRRCHLEYTRLQFQDSIAIWQDFVAYRWATRQAYERKNAPNGRNALDINFSDLQIDSTHPIAQLMYGSLVDSVEQQRTGFSMHDVEKLMEFQVSEMQRLGGRLPDDMKHKLDRMSKSGVPTPKLAYYLKFLDSWRAGDYSSAFENLHQYFDYTMQTRDRTFYQYALLNLAILQADFGCHSEAVPAMQEAIATARENKDATCLNFCMSWLYHFGRSFPAEMQRFKESGILGSETEGLAFLKARARDAEMWSLLSTSLLSEAKLGLQHGDSLALVFENIAKASHLNVVKSVQNITGATLLMKGSAYGRVGLTHLAWTCGETFLECFADVGPMEDVLKCTCRMAGLLSQRGRYEEAMDTLGRIPERILRVLKYQNYWKFYSGVLKLRRFLHRDDLTAAEHMMHMLKGQGAPDVEIGYALSFSEVELLIRRRKLTEALELVDKLAEKAVLENNDVVVQVRLLNLKARIFALCRHPFKGFTNVVHAAQISYRARTLASLWESIGILSHILIQMQEFAASADMLESIIPQVLECQDCELAARTSSYLADANMGMAGKTDAKSTKRKEYLSKAMELITNAHEQYRRIEDLKGQMEMLAKKATIMHYQGDLVLANDTATQYLELKKEYAASNI